MKKIFFIAVVAIFVCVSGTAQVSYTATARVIEKIVDVDGLVRLNCEGELSFISADYRDQPELRPVLLGLQRGDVLKVKVFDGQVLSVEKIGHEGPVDARGPLYTRAYREQVRRMSGYGYGYAGAAYGAASFESRDFGAFTNGEYTGVRTKHFSVVLPTGRIARAISASKKKSQQTQTVSATTQQQTQQTVSASQLAGRTQQTSTSKSNTSSSQKVYDIDAYDSLY